MSAPDLFSEDPRPERRGDFEEWWEAYPHKVGKGAARHSYRRAIAKADRLVLLDGVRRYVAAKPADRPWCNPSTWLNQERWTDQPAENVRNVQNGPNEHVLKGNAELIAKGINVPTVTRRQLADMLARGWLTEEQARRAGL